MRILSVHCLVVSAPSMYPHSRFRVVGLSISPVFSFISSARELKSAGVLILKSTDFCISSLKSMISGEFLL